MNFKKGDTVFVISGKFKDNKKERKILSVDRKNDRVVVEGVNIAKKHIKGDGQNPGSIEEITKPIHVSNIMIKDPKTGKRSRIGHEIKDNKKIRVAKKSGKALD
jgi:ribosomal protein L24, bacterial/organelle